MLTADLADGLRSSGFEVELERPGDDADLVDVTHDSRAVAPGALFACIPGAAFDGHDFAPEAVGRGAAALLLERPLDLGVPSLRVPSVRRVLGPAASLVHGEPSRALRVVGITGTNGKTTTAALLASILRTAGLETEVSGTLTGSRTTPEGSDLQRQLRAWVDRGVEAVVMEVSSHALDLRRVDGTHYEVGVFLNLSPEHLDFHGTMAAYEAAKTRLFTDGLADAAVVLVDDDAGRRIAAGASVPVERCSITDATDLVLGTAASVFRWRGVDVELPLPGRFNVANAVAAATTAAHLGVSAQLIADGLAAVGGIDGRLERVDAGQPFTVLVDYAHTPDALERALVAVRELLDDGRLIVLFGAGGDRDREKRPLMGAAAARHADVVIVTSDNPRSEDPDAIISAILSGVPDERCDAILREPDRRAAIGLALDRARPGDVVLLAGKGHETTQEQGGVVSDFDDRLVAAEVLADPGRSES